MGGDQRRIGGRPAERRRRAVVQPRGGGLRSRPRDRDSERRLVRHANVRDRWPGAVARGCREGDGRLPRPIVSVMVGGRDEIPMGELQLAVMDGGTRRGLD